MNFLFTVDSISQAALVVEGKTPTTELLEKIKKNNKGS